MNVSRIEAFNPAVKINWQVLTAREILRFNNLGVQVPDEYLNWAKEFIEKVYDGDKDKVTFEMAQSVQDKPVEDENKFEVNSVQSSTDLNEEKFSQNPVETEITSAQVENTEESIIEDENSISQTPDAVNNADVTFNQNAQHDTQISELEQQMQIILSNAGVLNNNTQNEFGENLENNSSSQRIIELRNQIEQFKKSGNFDSIYVQSEFDRLNFELDSQLFSILNSNNSGLLVFNPEEGVQFENMNNDKNDDLDELTLGTNNGNDNLLKAENRLKEKNLINDNKSENNENDDVVKETEIKDDSPEAKLSNPSKASLDEILKRKIRRGIEL